MTRWCTLTVTLFALIALDRATKIIMVSWSAERRPLLFPGLLELTSHENYGIIANIPLPGAFILIVTAIAIVILSVGILRAMRRNAFFTALPLVVILAGAIGNLWDRIAQGYVYDWLLLFGRSAVNIADGCIVVGLVWYLAQETQRNRPVDDSVKSA